MTQDASCYMHSAQLELLPFILVLCSQKKRRSLVVHKIYEYSLEYSNSVQMLRLQMQPVHELCSEKRVKCKHMHNGKLQIVAKQMQETQEKRLQHNVHCISVHG